MYSDIKKEACDANIALASSGLVEMTFGNAGVFDASKGVFAIKPSGVDYAELSPDKMVVIDLQGDVIEGDFNPSSDTPTYVELFKNFKVRSIVHTHSVCACAFAQALRGIPAFGTTHADHFYGEVPLTRELTKAEIEADYEAATGRAIVERFNELKLEPLNMPAVLVRCHGVFTWGGTWQDGLKYAIALELCAKMARDTLILNPQTPPMPAVLLDKHFLRKHGANAYYGQGGK